jgi:hypothetical protein
MTYSRTRTHRLKFSGGRRIVVQVTELADAVHLSISGPRLCDADMPRMARLMWPILFAFEEDPRPIYMSGEHVNYTGCVVPVDGGFLRVHIPNPRGQH